ncbi:hypothetical protein R6Q59_010142 [Mikania micrantha]
MLSRLNYWHRCAFGQESALHCRLNVVASAISVKVERIQKNDLRTWEPKMEWALSCLEGLLLRWVSLATDSSLFTGDERRAESVRERVDVRLEHCAFNER